MSQIESEDTDWKNLGFVGYQNEVARCIQIIAGTDNRARVVDLLNKREDYLNEKFRQGGWGTPERPETVAMELIKNNEDLLHKMMDSRYDNVAMDIETGRF
jgi:hypothetical protein